MQSQSRRRPAAQRALLLLLVPLVVLVQMITLLHCLAHATDATMAGMPADCPMHAEAAEAAGAGDAHGVADLFSGHDEGSPCCQAFHSIVDAAPPAPAWDLRVERVAATAPVPAPEQAPSHTAALFEARGPPAFLSV